MKSSVAATAGLLCVTVTVWARSSRLPEFKSVPTTVKTSENDTVLLPCYVDNLGTNIVRWWWDQKLLVDSSDPDLTSPPRVRMWPNHTLEVTDLKSEDTGEYICEVVRPAPWGPMQQVHAIEVLYPPEVSPVPASGELKVVLGEEVLIACEAIGVPQPIITWTNKGEEIQLLDNRPKLRFLADNRTQSGTYQCIASNGVGDPATAEIELRILYPPEIKAESSWIHASPGLRVTLSCMVTADPEATVKWLKNGQPLETTRRIDTLSRDDLHMLLFRSVSDTDFGHYACQASNNIGSNQQVIQLSGAANPAVFKSSSRVASGNNYTLIWEVDSYSRIIDYNLLFRKLPGNSRAGEWVRLTIPADGGGYAPLHSKSYTLTGLQSASVYEVTLMSRNKFGWSKLSPVLRFATEGTDVEKKELIIQIESKSEENLLPAEVAAILRNHNHGSVLQSDGLLMMAMLLAVQWLLQGVPLQRR